MGYLISLTGNADINAFAIKKFEKQFGENGAFRLASTEEINHPATLPEKGLFSPSYDFIRLLETAEKYPSINEVDIKDKKHYDTLIDKAENDSDIIPIFTKSPDGKINIMPNDYKDFTPKTEGHKMVYMGKTMTEA